MNLISQLTQFIKDLKITKITQDTYISVLSAYLGTIIAYRALWNISEHFDVESNATVINTLSGLAGIGFGIGIHIVGDQLSAIMHSDVPPHLLGVDNNPHFE